MIEGEIPFRAMMAQQGWTLQAYDKNTKLRVDEYIFKKNDETPLWDGGTRQDNVVIKRDAVLMFSRYGNIIFADLRKGMIYKLGSWPTHEPNVSVPTQTVEVVRYADFLASLGSVSPSARSFPSGEDAMVAVRASSRATNQDVVSKAAARAAPKVA